ncbi:MAG: carboxypeptidase regulatory-like domain-containing protein [candidate division WOR-3 bacterium]|nr:MAG: carboxypeptidase regulatory-like domain-containing protein [candidate division WOR-3 bacterium]
MRAFVPISVAAAMLSALTGAALAAGHRDLVLVEGADRSDVPGIAECGVVINRVGTRAIEAEANARQQDRLRALGWTVRTITPEIDEVYRMNSLSVADDAWYMPYTDFRDTMITIAQNNSSFIKLETLGMSVSNRLILAMKFSDNPQQNENEPEVHFESNIHGDEKITWGVLMELVKYLASGYGSDTLVTRLVNEREIWLLPMVNPDGYEVPTRYNDNRVDLNRNWGWMWQNGYARGSGPMSEPESRAQLGHIMRHPFVTYVSYHSGTEFISHPWSYTYARHNTIPELTLIKWLSARYDHYTHYAFGQGADSMYSINGSTKDFNYGFDGSMGWSIEVHYTKTPPASEIVPTFNKNRPAILEFCHHAGKGIHGKVTDAATGRPVHAQVIVDPADWHSYTDAETGDFHRFYLPGTYDLTFRAPGYVETTISDVTVPNSGDSAITVNVSLEADSTAPLFGFRLMYCEYIRYPDRNRTYPVQALGPHDGVGYQLAGGTDNNYVCIDMDRPVRDLAGPDLTVYRSSGAASATVKGSHSWTGPWTTIGTASSAETSFDLSAVGLDSVRYVRLDASGTFVLDAVEGANYTGIVSRPEPLPRPIALSVRQNPTQGRVAFGLNRPPDAGTRILVHDLSGRIVRRLPASSQSVLWDRAGDDGRLLPAGVYFARVKARDAAPVRIVLTE